MPIRRRIAGRSDDGRTLEAIAGAPLPWKYDVKENAYYAACRDGARYAVARSRPTDMDRRGHKLYPYWMARAITPQEIVNLGDEYMNEWEGMEVCQIYESARLDRISNGDNTRRTDQGQSQSRLEGTRRLLSDAGSNGNGGSGS
jgi:hypothetical protein